MGSAVFIGVTMRINFFRQNKLPSKLVASSIYVVGVAGRANVADIVVVGKNANDVRRLASGSIQEVNTNSNLHPELNVF